MQATNKQANKKLKQNQIQVHKPGTRRSIEMCVSGKGNE